MDYWKLKPGFGATWRVLEVVGNGNNTINAESSRKPALQYSTAIQTNSLSQQRVRHHMASSQVVGVFGGVPPRYVRFDPPLKPWHNIISMNYHTMNRFPRLCSHFFRGRPIMSWFIAHRIQIGLSWSAIWWITLSIKVNSFSIDNRSQSKWYE